MRIGINVPDDLLKKVREIRPEVNISQICREAMELRVSAHKRAIAQLDADEVDQHIVRLAGSTSGSLVEPDWETYGLEDAREWVKVVTPEKWEFFIYQCDHLSKNGRDGTSMVKSWSRGDGIRGLMGRIREHWDWMTDQHEYLFSIGQEPNLHDKATREYARGWLTYVMEVRHRLEQYRKDEYEKVKAERDGYRQSLPDVELPPQLM